MDAAIHRLVVFTLGNQRYALHLSVVERVVPVAQITLLPKAPDIVLGIINVAGSIVPVLDTRRRFGLTARNIDLSDQLIIARTSRRPVALVVEAVAGVVECAASAVTAADRILHEAEYVEGVIKLCDGLILIHDLDTFLSPLEERVLDGATAPD